MTTTTRADGAYSADAATWRHSRRLHLEAQTAIHDLHVALGEHARDRRSCSASPETQANPALQPGRVTPRCSYRCMRVQRPGASRRGHEASAEAAPLPGTG